MKKNNKRHLNLLKYKDIKNFNNFIDYYYQLIKTEEGKKNITILKRMFPTKTPKEVHPSITSCFSEINYEMFAMWYMWAQNEFGIKLAKKYLNDYSNSNDITIIYNGWISGIKLNKTLKINDRLSLIPIFKLPDSPEKEEFTNTNKDSLVFTKESSNKIAKPEVAIVLKEKIKKVYKLKNDEYQDDCFRDKIKNINLVENTALLLNLMDNVSCYIHSYTERTLPTSPSYFFNLSKRTTKNEKSIKAVNIAELDTNLMNKLIKSLNSMEGIRQTQIRFALSYLSNSMLNIDLKEKILNLCIALEMILLDDNQKEQLSLSFRLRGSQLISVNDEEKYDIYQKLKKIYNYRSQISHTGRLKTQKIEGIENTLAIVYKEFDDFIIIAKRIFVKIILIEKEKINWNKIILGINDKKSIL